MVGVLGEEPAEPTVFTYQGAELERTEDGGLCLPGQDDVRFTGEQVVKALMAKALLGIQSLQGDTVTTEIEDLLRVPEIWRAVEAGEEPEDRLIQKGDAWERISGLCGIDGEG